MYAEHNRTVQNAECCYESDGSPQHQSTRLEYIVCVVRAEGTYVRTYVRDNYSDVGYGTATCAHGSEVEIYCYASRLKALMLFVLL